MIVCLRAGGRAIAAHMPRDRSDAARITRAGTFATASGSPVSASTERQGVGPLGRWPGRWLSCRRRPVRQWDRPASSTILARMEARMSGATSPTGWTYAEYARLPNDGNRYEVLDGEVLVTPSPGTKHQRTAARLWRLLDDYVREHALGEVLWALDVLFAKGQYLCPDIVYVPNAQRDRLSDRGVEGVPDLVVEVVSTASVRIDRVKKPARYGDFGIPQYWVVDRDHSGVWVWDFDLGAIEPRLEAERITWQPEPSVPALVFEVPLLFEAP